MATPSTPPPGTDRSRLALGEYGEELAARWLAASGLAVLDRNWRTGIGEIDVVAREGDTLVVCEVKTRTSRTAGLPHQAITPAKLRRLQTLGLLWAEQHRIRPSGVRVDLVAVVRPRRGVSVVEHVRGVG